VQPDAQALRKASDTLPQQSLPPQLYEWHLAAQALSREIPDWQKIAYYLQLLVEYFSIKGGTEYSANHSFITHSPIMKLLIRNLSRTTTEAELKALFEAHGKVQSCNLVMDNKTGLSKGFGFVEMPKPGEAKAAMKSTNGSELNGNTIRVKKAEDKAASQ
jgi:hypothetical protein